MYTLEYFHDGASVDTDKTMDNAVVQDMLNVALDLKMCDAIIMQCICEGDLAYTNEFFLCGGEWFVVLNNTLSAEKQYFTIKQLGKGK